MQRTRNRLVRIVLLTAGVASLLTAPRQLRAQDRHCATPHDVGSLGPTRYMLRGSRCEGVIAREIGGDVIRVVGLTRSVETSITRRRGPSRRLERGGGRLGVAGRHRIAATGHCRWMPRSADRGEFRWPVGVLDAGDSGAATSGSAPGRRIGSAPERALLVPVRLWQKTAADDERHRGCSSCRSCACARSWRAVTRLDSAGRDLRVLRDARALGVTDLRAEEAVPITLPELSTPGMYRVRIAGEYYDRVGTTSTEVLVLGWDADDERLPPPPLPSAARAHPRRAPPPLTGTSSGSSLVVAGAGW